MSILVTGGAGYIGAHVVRLLQERGEKIVVVDDLSSGRAERIGDAHLLQVDISRDEAYRQLTDVMVDEDVEAVIHFAARKQVQESVERPSWYYRQNVGGIATLTRAMYDAGIDRMIFSSSAAVYGTPGEALVTEATPTAPINPYGETKLIGEMLLRDCERAWNLKWVGLRYVNAAGVGWDDLADPATLNLILIVLQRLHEKRTPQIFGDKYPTPDGTCVRDYIHVMDLAQAHLAALDALRDGRLEHQVFNVGTGVGTSVSEIIAGLRRELGWEFPVEVIAARPGDGAQLVADPNLIQAEIGWKAQRNVQQILSSAVSAWQQSKKRIEIPS